MALPPINVLSLFSGAGALDLAIRIAIPGARTICYVEREIPAVAILAARMADGSLDSAPIWSDVTLFRARALRGVVDLVIAGAPCQPYSVAGQQRGDEDERYLWGDIFRIVRECEPAMVFLENVPALLQWFRPIGEELCRMGYRLEAGLFSAAEVGAPHKRERLFVLAYRESRGFGIDRSTSGIAGHPDERDAPMADPGNGQLPIEGRRAERRTGTGPAGAVLADTGGPRHEGRERRSASRNRGGAGNTWTSCRTS